MFHAGGNCNGWASSKSRLATLGVLKKGKDGRGDEAKAASEDGKNFTWGGLLSKRGLRELF